MCYPFFWARIGSQNMLRFGRYHTIQSERPWMGEGVSFKRTMLDGGSGPITGNKSVFDLLPVFARTYLMDDTYMSFLLAPIW